MPSSLFVFRTLLPLFLLVAMAFHASADEYSDVAKLMKSNQMSEALAKVDQFLSTKPRDPQMRFMRGVIQSEVGKASDAITTFTRLTEDYPELPEPYNNLAVLYASSNQFEKAKGALEMAIRTNPSYSTAHENLGDIYAKLASAAYAKALQLDSTNTAISPKLALIRELFAPNAKPSASAPQATSKSNSSAPAVLTTSPVKAVTPSAPPPAPTAVVAVPASPTSASSSGSSASAARDVEQAVENWAKAWSERDMKAYLGSYAKDFSPSGKLSRGDWEEERKSRIMGKAKIRVKLSNITVTVTGNTASAKFKQEYKADALTANSRKTLDLVRSGDRWLITKEFSG